MRLLDLTLATPEENLALDEALLDEADRADEPREILRIWESPAPLVVLGRSSRITEEVNAAYCQANQIPILRRPSGGAAIVAGPGCLMYALVLCYESRPVLRAIDTAHGFVLETMLAGLRPIVKNVARRGTSDLAIGEAKFSGNSMRAKRRAFLYHGTLLYDFQLPLIPDCLKQPPRQPAYRNNRAHEDFVTNLPINAQSLRRAVARAWQADATEFEWPRQRVAELVASRYSQPGWNGKL